MNQTTNNHYSPVFTNRPWANTNGHIIRLRWDAVNKVVVQSRTGPMDWGSERYLYPQMLEDALARFEGIVSRVYRKLLTGEVLSTVERLIWSSWIICQFSRTPSLILELAGIKEDVLTKFPGIDYDLSWAETKAEIDAAIQNIQDFQSSEQLFPFIILRDWVVLRPAAGEFFIKGDVPVVIRGALIDDDATIVYPLGPSHCFVATVLKGFPPHQIQVEYPLKPGEAAYYVRLVAACADIEVICHPDNCSKQLEALIGDVLGAPSPHFTLGHTPGW
jgi:hypothetical protein